jgi:cytochrome c oxidase assembly protein subunit 15
MKQTASPGNPPRLLYRYAQLLSALVVFLLVAGAMVTSTGSGLAVPDWPLSFGQVMPPMEGGVFYEHGHRMVAATVGFLTIILAVWVWRRETRSWMRRLGWAALVLVVLQGVLGGMTVLLKLPVWTSAAHACLAQAFFMVIVFMALALSPGWSAPAVRGGANLRTLATLTTVAIYVQLILGAVMRHMNAALVIPDFPLVYGGVVPPAFTPAVGVHYAHRVWAIVVTALVITTAIATLRSVSRADFRRPAILLLVLVVVQVLLGGAIIWTQRQVGVATLHVVTGAVLLATSLVLTVRTWRFVDAPRTQTAPAAARGGVDMRKATV